MKQYNDAGNLPNFLIIGAAKAGTTSLRAYLMQHPEIFMCPVNEPKFFALEGHPLNFAGPGDRRANRQTVTDMDQYKALFQGVTSEKAVGEKSPIYLYSPVAPQKIKSCVPGVRIIAILRNPVDRAYSSFLHLRRDGREPLDDFGRALAEEENRIRDNWAHGWHYRNLGYYFKQLSRYYDLFDSEQIRVHLYQELRDSPLELLKDLFGFLGVSTAFQPDVSLRHNPSGIPRHRRIHTLLKYPHVIKDFLKPLFPQKLRKTLKVQMMNRNLQKAPPLDPGIHEVLRDAYRADVQNLQKLIQRDLSNWLIVPKQPKRQVAQR